MTAGQTSVGSNGYQNLLFPLDNMYITQGEGGTGSHEGTYNMDFSGWGANGKIYQCPYYAPCDLRLQRRTGSGYLWVSINPVNYVDGTLDYITIDVAHDDDRTKQAGDIVYQGQVLGHTGTYGNVTGDHVHISIGKGNNNDLITNQYGHSMVSNPYHIYNAMGVNDTILTRPLNYNWQYFTPTPTPPIPPIGYTRKSHFKFYLYRKDKN